MSPEQLLGQFESDDRVVLADMEAGLGLLTRMSENSLDWAFLVTNPTVKSLEVVRRALEIIAERKITASIQIIANRIRIEDDLEQVRSALNVTDVVVVPEDPGIRLADFDGLSPMDAAPDSLAVKAIAALANGQQSHVRSE